MITQRSVHRVTTRLAAIGLGVALLLGSACSSTGAKGAVQGATVGAAAGAVGGLLSAAIFGGDPARAAGRGAAYGAGSGAVSGGIRGEQRHAAEQERARAEAAARAEAEAERLRAEIGDDAYQGLVALTDGKHEVALAYARTAARSATPDHALAGRWLEALTHADRGDEDAVRRSLVEIAADDPALTSDGALLRLRELEDGLRDIRAEYGIESHQASA